MLTYRIVNFAAVGGRAHLESQPKLGTLPRRRAGTRGAGPGRSAGSGVNRKRAGSQDYRSMNAYTDFLIL